MWITKAIAVRALLHLVRLKNNDPEFTQTELGLSGGLEYHFAAKELSPYAGGFVGVLSEMMTDVDTLNTMYMGGFFGVELELFKSISLFGEYNLILINYEWGSIMDFGNLSEGQIGILIYF